MPREKGTGTGTRNLNGMGNLYINKATGRIEYRIMQNGRLRVATGTSAKEVNERKKLITGVSKVKQKVKFYEYVENIWLKNHVKPYLKGTTYKQYEDTWKCTLNRTLKMYP